MSETLPFWLEEKTRLARQWNSHGQQTLSKLAAYVTEIVRKGVEN